MSDRLVTTDYTMHLLLAQYGDPFSVRRMSKSFKKNSKTYKEFLEKDLISRDVRVALDKYVDASRAHSMKEIHASKVEGKPVRLEVPRGISGNLAVWEAMDEIVKVAGKSRNFPPALLVPYKSVIVYSVQSALRRSGSVFSVVQQKIVEEFYIHELEKMLPLMYIKDAISKLALSSVGKYNSLVKTEVEGKAVPERYNKTILIDKKFPVNLDIETFGGVSILTIGEKRIVLSNLHLMRLRKLLTAFINLFLATADIPVYGEKSCFYTNLCGILIEYAKGDPEGVGELFKGARSYMICLLDETHLMGGNPAKSLAATWEETKRGKVLEIVEKLRGLTPTIEDAINLANIFRLIPHPDSNMAEAFDTIRGVKEPNTVDRNILPRFEGILKRSLYRSLTQQGYQVRLISIGPLGNDLENMTNSVSPKQSKIMSAPYTNWSDVVFSPVHNMTKPSEIVVPASSKASQIHPEAVIPLSESLIDKDGFYTREATEFIEKARTINDAVSEIKNKSELDADAAIKHFEKVIKLHEKLEARFPGIPPEEIPQEIFEEFIKENSDMMYLVGTEPKFGEFHKKVTRMFYMGEQKLKAITQRVERLARQVSRRQFGVSIVKAYRARRADLEAFCRAMGSTIEGLKALFVSFDMSEFSKKFPMELMRIYGTVLAQIYDAEWLSRIDIIFRASMVIHNSRGFFDILFGVKGGFEGFFNFVWSSIHAVVMEMALDALGYKGNLLTFSDDGLLLIYLNPNMTKDEKRELMIVIQDIYKRCGLVFHLGKTLVSEEVWEYLGDVCYKGKLIPMWVKEACSVGKKIETSGINPFYQDIRSLEGQADAMVSAGGNPLTAFILKRILFEERVNRLGMKITPAIMEVLSILPSNTGGLRITSPYEMMVQSTIETDAEILADIHLLSKSDEVLASGIMSMLSENVTKKKRVLGGIMSGNSFSTDIGNTSGMDIINKAIEEAKENYENPKELESNPFEGEFGNNLEELLKTLEDINLEAMQQLIMTTPVYQNYTRSVALMRSEGAVRLVSRKTLRYLQSNDTNNVRKTISYITNYLRDSATNKFRLMETFSRLREANYLNLSLAPIRPSPRVALTRVDQLGDIQVRVEPHNGRSMASSTYIEPHLRQPKDITTISWNSERTGDFKHKTIRRFAESVAKYLAFSPRSETFVRSLANIMGISLPHIPVGLVTGAHRNVGSGDLNLDFKLTAPRVYLVNSVARYIGATASNIYGLGRIDRTTYPESARALTYFDYFVRSLGFLVPVSKVLINEYIFDKEFFDLMHITKETSLRGPMRALPNAKELDEQSRTDYRNAFMEYIRYSKFSSRISDMDMPEIAITDVDRRMINELSVASLSKWIVDTISLSTEVIIPEAVFPTSPISQFYVVRRAAILSAYRMMNPVLKGKLSTLVIGYIFRKEGDSKSLDELNNSTAFSEFRSRLVMVCTLLSSSNLPGISDIDLANMMDSVGLELDDLSDIVRSSIMNAAGKIVVMRTPSHPAGKFSRAHRIAYTEAFNTTLQYIYKVCEDEKWDRNLIAKRLNITSNIDDLIDLLTISKTILRESPHRSSESPYNKTAFYIHVRKFYSFLEYVSLNMDDITDDNTFEEYFNEYTLTLFEKERLITEVKPKAGEVGPDHLKIIDEPLDTQIMGRAKAHYHALSRGRVLGSSASEWKPYVMDKTMLNGIITSFYQLIIQPAARSLVEYPASLDKEILVNFYPSTRAKNELMSLTVTPYVIAGNILNVKKLTDIGRIDVTKLLTEHVKAFVLQEGISGVTVPDDASLMLAKACSSVELPNCPKIRMYDDFHKSDIRVLLLLHTDINLAVTSYANLASLNNSLVTIFKDTDSSNYAITAVFLDQPIRVIDTTNKKTKITIDVPEVHPGKISDMISTMTVLGKSDVVRANYDYKIKSANLQVDVPPRVSYVINYLKEIGTESQVNNENYLIQAATELAKESYMPGVKLACYALVLLWLRGESDLRNYRGLIIMLNNKLKDKLLLMSLANDIALTFTWLMVTRLSMSIEMPVDNLKVIKAEVIETTCCVELPLTATTLRPRPIREVLALFIEANTRKIIGEVASYIYNEPPRILELEYDTANLSLEDEAALAAAEDMFE
ncbi:RNA-dependent RNA polymerase [Shahe yuevirus-like virus 1]|uniref:RNA-dependent RNA polymerase n=1 Tax=Shahe yuevirus-like virus 1 TaxID=1923457 RepID=A0A1L3KL52_9VIRU|nr:RNA-dependent RNA polymerase [Shahe yuevirus-like virus 1]APG78141.1 RNA-dependent RNA polymerase [Shahe yuevirus-like virus 1]